MENLPLLLLPGTLCDDRVWQPMLDQLPARLSSRQVYTHVLQGQRSTRAMAAALLQAAPPRFALMGFSLGGIVALEMAAQAPDRLAGLALVAANARPDPPENAANRRAAVAVAERDGIATHIKRDLWPLYVADSRLQDEALQRQVSDMAICLGTRVYADQAEMALDRADSRPRLRDIDMPALIVSGADDKLVPADRQQELACGIRDAVWVALQGVGHMVPLEAAEDLAKADHAWLTRVDAVSRAQFGNA
jgi:pimeloyl-ACP methyl ester carboxylesterase